MITDQPKYLGVGGHLFAIAADFSEKRGFGGTLTGFAANEDLVRHYQEKFHAEHIGALHPFQILIDEVNAGKIMEVYEYEWTDDEL